MTTPSEEWKDRIPTFLGGITFPQDRTYFVLDSEIKAFIAKVRQEAYQEGREAAIEAIESALSRIKHRSYIEALPDNGEDNGKPEKVVTYENVRVVFNDLLDDLSTGNEEGE